MVYYKLDFKDIMPKAKIWNIIIKIFVKILYIKGKIEKVNIEKIKFK